MLAFVLGREFKLSIAELFALFPNMEVVASTEKILIADHVSREEITQMFPRIGGTIKIIEILRSCRDKNEFSSIVEEELSNNPAESKLSYAIASYGENNDVFALGLQIKKRLKKTGRSFRLSNKDKQNINSATYKKEKLGETGTEFNYISAGGAKYVGRTVVYQDVDLYSERDTEKSRDMQVGMLPPKLAQMMLNLTGRGSKVYDPYCGLGTILIEAANAGLKDLVGSDISADMVQSTTKSLSEFLKKKELHAETRIFKLDASKLMNGWKPGELEGYSIVTEGYLGEVMNQKNISMDRIKEQKRRLVRMYDGFFSELKQVGFKGKIVISFPFWEMEGKYIYLEEIYELLSRLGFEVAKLLPENMEFSETRSGSLLYKRPGQTVGREVFKLEKR